MTDSASLEGTDINSERKLHQSDSREAQMEFSFAYGWVVLPSVDFFSFLLLSHDTLKSC